MQVGDLVAWSSLGDPDGSQSAHGLVVELCAEEDSATGTIPACFWVKWHGHADWSMTYEDEVVVISELGS